MTNLTCASRQQDRSTSNDIELGAPYNFNVSLMSLIVRPESFNKRRLQVQGILSIGFEGNGLFFRKEDYDYGLTANAVWLDVTPEQSAKYNKFVGQMVSVVGTFNANNHGHMGAYGGGIQVESIAGYVPNAPSSQLAEPGSAPATPPN